MSMGVAVPASSGGAAAYRITIVVDGSAWDYSTSQDTVGAILKEAGVELGQRDVVRPALRAKPGRGATIRVTRVTAKLLVQTEPVRYRKVSRFDPYGSGLETVLRKGQPGEKVVKYRITCRDGVQTGREVISSRITRKPVSEVVSVSRAMVLASRSGSYTQSVRMVATAYDPGPRSCGKWATGRTACGMRAGKGVVAVDPRFIRLGTKLYVEGYGFCIAGDTGGAVKGNRIDLGFNTYSEAIQFGRRTVTVYILD